MFLILYLIIFTRSCAAPRSRRGRMPNKSMDVSAKQRLCYHVVRQT